ncbi:MAG: cytochrome c oxidase subunit II [Acidimicrobiales bacterium]
MLGLAGTGCGDRYGAPEPATTQGAEVLDLWRVLYVVALAVGALVSGLILWAVVRYRRRPGRDPATFSDNVKLELFYTAVPLVTVAVLFAMSVGVQREVTRLAPEPDLRIEVTAFQWGWRFRYLTEGITIVGTSNDPPTMVLPIDATARLVLISPDVVHSFFVPEFLEKRDLVPGVENRIDVTPSRLGRFGGLCAEFCGLDHTRMTFVVEIVQPEEFEAFVAEQQQQPQGGTVPPGTQGGADEPAGRAAPPPPPRRETPPPWPNGVTVR